MELPTTAKENTPGAGLKASHLGATELLRILRRHRKLIGLTVFAIVGLTALVLVTMTPRYKAEAVISVEMPSSLNNPTGDAAAVAARPAEEEMRISNVMQLLQSRGLARLVVRDLALQDDREFNPKADSGGMPADNKLISWLKSLRAEKPKPARRNARGDVVMSSDEMDEVADRLMSRLEISQAGKSNIIHVSATSTSPEQAQRIANKLVNILIRQQVSKREGNLKETIEQLGKRVEQLRGQVIEADRKVAAYRKAHGIPEAGTEDAQIARLSSELAGARSARADSEARANAMTGAGVASTSSPMLANLQSQEVTLQRRVAELSAMYGDGHPDMVNAKAQLREVQSRIAGEVRDVSRSLQAESATRRSSEAQIAGTIGSLRAQSFEHGLASVGLMDLQRDADTSRTLYVNLLSRLKDLQRQEQVGRADASFISRADVPEGAYYPATKRALAIAFVASLILSTILAFMSESIDNKVRTSDQIHRLTGGAETLAMIPEIPERWGDLPPYVAVMERPCSAYSEAIRTVQLELASRRPDRAVQIVVITSPLPGEGKTTIAMGLAAAGAATGLNSVIVDLDLRRPGLPGMAESIAAGPDLLSYLTNEATVDEIVRTDSRVPQLAMIGVKHAARDPGALLASQRLARLIGELGTRYRLIVLNSAPLLPVRDAKKLASFADDVLMVVHWGKTPPDALRSATKMLGRDLTGAVLNRVNYKKHASLVYGDAIQHYSKYSIYYGDDEVAEPAWDPENEARAKWRNIWSSIWPKAA